MKSTLLRSNNQSFCRGQFGCFLVSGHQAVESELGENVGVSEKSVRAYKPTENATIAGAY